MKKESILTFIQFLFSFITIVFCMYQIKHTSGDVSVYISLISSILGYWLPSPIENKR